MYLGRVIGTAVCERKAPGLVGRRLLVVQPLDPGRRPSGRPEVAVDTVSASPGSLVLLVGSREAALALGPGHGDTLAGPSFVPVDAAIVGLVDAATVEAGDVEEVEA